MNSLRIGLLVAIFSLGIRAGADTYKLKEGDTVGVRYALRLDGLGVEAPSEMQVEIPPTGILTLPYVGDVKAIGFTVTELQAEITKSLRKRFPMAESFVLLSSIRRTSYAIIGEVRRGGQFPLTPGLTLREALALSGGTERRPELLRAGIFREGKLYREFDLYNVASTDEPAGSELLMPGDVISIQTKRQVRVWTAGLSKQPGENTVEEGTTVRQLISAVASVTTDRTGTGESREHVIVSVARNGEQVYRQTVFDIDNGRAAALSLEDGDFVTISLPETVRVWVFGEVARPGQYDVPADSNVLQGLAAAGGGKPTATLKDVAVLRGAEMISLDVSASSRRPADKMRGLEEGDILLVNANARRIAVLGEVNLPGLHYITDELEPRVSDAVSLANGLTKRGPATRIAILRATPEGEVKRIPVDFSKFLKYGKQEFNPPVMPGDVVVVGETPRIDIRELISIALGLVTFRNLIR